MKKLLRNILNDEDLKVSGFNFAIVYFIGNVVNVILSTLLTLNINKYHSIDHIAIGVGVGTFAYRKAGKGTRGVLIGLATATLFNVLWECFEIMFNPYHSIESLTDIVSDIAFVYCGAVLSFVLEKFKDILGRD